MLCLYFESVRFSICRNYSLERTLAKLNIESVVHRRYKLGFFCCALDISLSGVCIIYLGAVLITSGEILCFRLKMCAIVCVWGCPQIKSQLT